MSVTEEIPVPRGFRNGYSLQQFRKILVQNTHCWKDSASCHKKVDRQSIQFHEICYFDMKTINNQANLPLKIAMQVRKNGIFATRSFVHTEHVIKV